MTWSARMPTATSSAVTVQPASDGHASGIARVTMAKRNGSLPPPTPPKPTLKSEGLSHENANSRIGLSRLLRHRRPGMGLYLSPVVRGEKGRGSPRDHRQAGAGGGTSSRQEPALSPRAGRRIAEGNRSASSEGQEDLAEHPSYASGPEL